MDFLSWLTLHGSSQAPNDVLVLNSLIYAPKVSDRLSAYSKLKLDRIGQIGQQLSNRLSNQFAM